MKIFVTGGSGDLGKDPKLKPSIQDISETKKWLNYHPSYSPLHLLQDLAQYGEKGPPVNYE